MKERPVYREPLIPWYDSSPVCRILFWLLVPVLAFAFIGFHEALKTPDWKSHIWVPLALGLMSLFLMLRMVVRLHRRKKVSDDG